MLLASRSVRVVVHPVRQRSCRQRQAETAFTVASTASLLSTLLGALLMETVGYGRWAVILLSVIRLERCEAFLGAHWRNDRIERKVAASSLFHEGMCARVVLHMHGRGGSRGMVSFVGALVQFSGFSTFLVKV